MKKMEKIFFVERKKHVITVLKMKLRDLEPDKLSNKFKSHMFDPEFEIYVKCNRTGEIEYRGGREEYRLYDITKHDDLSKYKYIVFENLQQGNVFYTKLNTDVIYEGMRIVLKTNYDTIAELECHKHIYKNVECFQNNSNIGFDTNFLIKLLSTDRYGKL